LLWRWTELERLLLASSRPVSANAEIQDMNRKLNIEYLFTKARSTRTCKQPIKTVTIKQCDKK